MPKFEDFDQYYASLTPQQSDSIRRFVEYVSAAHPEFELVLAWNQPMFRIGTKYILGFMPTKGYINMATVSDKPILELGNLLQGYRHGGRTISLPFDWTIDEQLIEAVMASRLAELGLAS